MKSDQIGGGHSNLPEVHPTVLGKEVIFRLKSFLSLYLSRLKERKNSNVIKSPGKYTNNVPNNNYMNAIC